MTRSSLIIAASLGSLALLLGAFGFQALGYAPCQMCIWQRWPHGIAILLGVLALAVRNRLFPGLGALAAATTSGLGVFHTGVEKGWWEGITSCAGAGDITSLSASDLLDTSRDLGPPLVKCDEVAWEFLTLSMASWNALISAGLLILWIIAARRSG